jgi:phenylpropionate dioxygenase-like ring-hydroxylating dioxygenase large terminal subunit
MLINFWYPMAVSSELGEAPIRVTALGQSFALFRDPDGAAHCVADTCVHRGGSLGAGKLKDGCVECPYHGWRYAGDGRCTHIPTLAGDAKIPARARVDSYPVEERYGVVFAFLGDLPAEERPGIMEIPQWGQDGWSVTHLVYDWNASFERVIENGLDATHTEFVHPSAGLQGSFKPSDELAHEMVETEWGCAYRMRSPTLAIEHGHHGASHQWTFLGFNMKQFQGNFRFYSFVRPIDAHSVRRYLFHARDFQLGEKMDQELVKTTLGFEQEDRPVIEDMRPPFSPRDTSSELLLPEDQIMVRYREYLADWEARGWHLDLARIRADSERTVYAIPSPGRRESGSWVVRPAPLIPAAAAPASRTGS